MKKKRVKIASLVIFIIATLFLINSGLNITGGFLGASKSLMTLASFFIGVMLLFFAILVFSSANLTLEKKLTLSSSIKKHPCLLKMTREAVKNENVQREMNHLIEEMHKGNFEAGLGHPGHIEKTNIFYLRGRKGARLFYRQIGEDAYEIVAKSSKANEEEVMDAVRNIYVD